MSIDFLSDDVIAFRDKIRTAVANYRRSEGCSCCQGPTHDDDAKALATLLGVPMYTDASGFNFDQYATPGHPGRY